MFFPVHPRVCLDLATYDTREIKRLCQEILYNALDLELDIAKSKLHVIVLTKTLPRFVLICKENCWEGKELNTNEELEARLTNAFMEDLFDCVSNYSAQLVEQDEFFLAQLSNVISNIPDVFEEHLLHVIEMTK